MSTRCTFAHVDIAALQSNFRAISKFLSNNAGSPTPGIIAVVKANAYGHGAPAVALALQEAGAKILACADIEEAVVLRKAGVTIEILIFGALGVSEVDGVFDHNLTPTISTPGAARSLQAAAAKHGVAASLSSEDRHGYEPARAAARQPRVHAARADRQPQSGDRRCLHAFRDGGRAGFSAVSHSARAIRAGARAPAPAGRRSTTPARGQQRGDAARFACVVRPRAAGAHDVRRHPSAARVDDSARLRHVSPQPCRGGEGCARRRNRRIWRRAGRCRSQAASPSCRPGMPTASIAAWPAVARC